MFGHRRLRAREKRRYNEDAADEELEEKRKFNLDEQITAERFNLDKDKYLKKLTGETLTLRYIQKNGFDKPILVEHPTGLNLRMPSNTFSVKDVKNCVGSKRTLDVMDVQTQKAIEMSMKEWCKYYESKLKDKLLNVISLEFSHTKLDQIVDSPMIVKLLDWVDLAWPRILKQSQTESTNAINRMKYPKVQKYCLMSVKGSYTDFHIDFGGTSVWYHVLKGKKVFWMVPPTELNLTFYEEWILSGKQQDVFFGDTVEECFRIELEAGNTFFIPSGWIHAVYTPEDSLVFGGNFLHSYGIEKQLRVSQIEDATKVPIKFRYPFYTELLWYVLQHYVLCLTGKDHLIKQEELHDDEDEKTDDEKTEEEKEPQKRPSLSNKGRTRKVKGRRGKKQDQKQKKDDEETDNEEEKDDKTKIKSVTTCRMTKNSLLRLQYEVTTDEKIKSEKINSSSTPSSPTPPDPSPEKETQTAATSPQIDTKELAPQAELKNNGWSLTPSWTNVVDNGKEPKKICLTKFEINGLKCLVKYLSKLTGSKKNLPDLIKDSKALIDDTKKMIADHENDDSELAITGKPISHLSLASNITDMNQLIGQFFKIKDDSSSAEDEDISDQAMDNNLRTKKSSPDKKSNQNLSPAQPVPNKCSSTVTTDHSNSTNNKFSSPTKKEKTLPPPSVSPPPKPPSPPTRPLSYNQYTAKTKNRNMNEPLPGSFASLIAATSTERNSFDLSISESTPTVPLSISLGPDSSSKNAWGRSSTSSNEGFSPSFRKNDVQTPTTPNKWSSLMTSKTDSNKKQIVDKSSNNKTPNSPTPPKIVQPKPPIKFASLNQKPQNKEKLIFASTPYNSNAQGNQPRLQPNSIVNRPVQPFGPPFSAPSSAMFNQFPPPSPNTVQQPNNSSSHPRPPQIFERSINPTRMVQPQVAASTSPIKQFSPISPKPSTSQRKTDNSNQQIPTTLESKKYQTNQIPNSSSQNQPKSVVDQLNPMPMLLATDLTKNSQKPMDQSASINKPLLSISKDDYKGETSKLNKEVANNIIENMSTEIDKSASKQQSKPKNKRVKKNEVKSVKVEKPKMVKKETKKSRSTVKSKETDPTTQQNTRTELPPINAPLTAQTSMPMSANAFIMSRPVMNINGHAYQPQFQTVNNQATMNVLTRAGLSNFISPFAQQIPGLPTIHNINGARFILATAPQARPNITPHQNRLVAPVKGEPDNAALLSLATTALSAHPQTTYTHNSNPAPNVTQAILVRSPNPSTIYTSGQHLFRPITQPLLNTNMGPLMSKDGAQRPMALQTNLGSLVLARLSNQTGPRYLLASPMIQQAYQMQHRPPTAHQQAQSQATSNQMSSGSINPESPKTIQPPKMLKQDKQTEPIYRQPPKKMAKTMFVSPSLDQIQQNQLNVSVAFPNNSVNYTVPTGTLSTPVATPNNFSSAVNSNLLVAPMSSTHSPATKIQDKDTLAQNSPMNMNKSDVKNASKASKRPAKARHKRGGHRCQTRRMRCSKCPSCVRSDCGNCDTCKNMSKFGGPGTQKQACLARQCTNPQLPRNVVCEICNIDGFTVTNGESKNHSTLMECNTCYKIVHPQCFRNKRPDLSSVNGIIDTDFVNSWKCPGCISGKSNSPEV